MTSKHSKPSDITNKNNLDNNLDNGLDNQAIDTKPEMLKAWKVKLFVLLLCAISFFAGWQSSRSYMGKQCHLAGGHIILQDDLMVCEMP